jgi:hypothetical protein
VDSGNARRSSTEIAMAVGIVDENGADTMVPLAVNAVRIRDSHGAGPPVSATARTWECWYSGPRGVFRWLGRIGQLGPNRAQFIFSIFSLLSNFFSSLFLSLI